MMKAYEHPLYLQDVCRVASDWKEHIDGKSFMVSGATGLLGSFLADVVMKAGGRFTALGRSAAKAAERFSAYSGDSRFRFISHDINRPLEEELTADYVIHLASNTHPLAYSAEPVSTITTNIIGTQNMLEAARRCGAGRFAFASSNEIYGETRHDIELFDESYCGYIDCNTLRAGYPESKRCGEALCQAYARQYGMDIVIPRFTRSFGPTLLATDSKAATQFIRNAVNGEDIVLKSEGRQFYSYTYVSDAVAGLLTVLFMGESGAAYNIADESCDITLRDLAGNLAEIAGSDVVFDLPSEAERAGFSKATKARLDGKRLRALGWKPCYDIRAALERTVLILREAQA